MNKPHATLRPGPNIVMIVLWGVLALLSVSLCNPKPVIIMCIGAGLGAIGGYMQILGYRQQPDAFTTAKTAMAVRAQFKATKWGQRYIYFLWSSFAMIFILSFFLSATPLWANASGYFSMAFVREIITFRLTLALRQAPEPGK